jgi:hypothetical protein
VSKPVDPSPPRAPVLKNGSFLPVLTVAHKYLMLLELSHGGSQETDTGSNVFVSGIIKLSLKIFKINFFPAPKRRVHSAGAPPTKPIWDSWGNIGRKDKGKGLPSGNSFVLPRTTVLPAATIAFNNAIANDSNADWFANSLDLQTLKTVLSKTSLPKDFKLPLLSQVEYIDRMYAWVRENYDGTKPLHHLALLVGIIVASSLLPNLFIPKDLKKLFESGRADMPDKVRRIYEEMNWDRKSSTSGMKEKSVFISMFTTFIIAIYERESPLRRHMETTDRHGLGDAWTAKHC